jgi:hypothetical protein
VQRHRRRSGPRMVDSPGNAHTPRVHRVPLRHAAHTLTRSHGHTTCAPRTMPHQAPHRRLRLPLRPLATSLSRPDHPCEAHQPKTGPEHRHRRRTSPRPVDAPGCTHNPRVKRCHLRKAPHTLIRRDRHPPCAPCTVNHPAPHRRLRHPLRPLAPSLSHPSQRRPSDKPQTRPVHRQRR